MRSSARGCSPLVRSETTQKQPDAASGCSASQSGAVAIAGGCCIKQGGGRNFLKKASPSPLHPPPTSKTFRKRDFATEILCSFQLTYICISPLPKVFERMGARGKENFFQKVFLPPKKTLATDKHEETSPK